MKNHIFYISGGMGKNIIATAVISNLKKQFPNDRIIIASPYPDIWLDNPDVFAIENPENVTLVYEKYIHGGKSKIYKFEPYSNEDYFYSKKHLIQIWCDLYSIPCTSLDVSIYLKHEEIDKVKKLIGDKHIFLIQTNGGAQNQPYPISWSRDLPLPIAEIVCKEMKKKGYTPIQLRRKNQFALQNAEWLDLSVRESMALVELSEKRLFIDSIAQHTAAALKKPSVVTWISNNHKVFGYEMHTNIYPIVKPEFRHRVDSFLEQYNITGNIHECPYDTNLLFSPEAIVRKLLFS